MSGDGLYARAARVLAGGHAEHVPGTVSAPLTGTADAVEVGDLHVAPFFAGVLFTWRRAGVAERLAELLGHAQRLGQIGGWEENLTSGRSAGPIPRSPSSGSIPGRRRPSPPATCTTS